jgi:hypothetical protein
VDPSLAAPSEAASAPSDRGTRGWARGVPGTGLAGLLGRPYLPLDELLDLSELDAVHEEVCLALAQVPVAYTGGSHRSMRIMPQGRESDALVDYGEVVADLDAAHRERLASLADRPAEFMQRLASGSEVGEERDLPLNHRQMLWLERRHRVYFPWKAYVELMPNGLWGDKATAEGKRFTRTALAHFPRTIAWVRRLPFRWVGRCNVMGLAPNDHGTVHRDVVPEEQVEPDHFVTICPAGDKRLYLWDRERRTSHAVRGRAYWFNDADDHGVEADPWFRYSIRIDGVFEPAFLDRLRRATEAPTAAHADG